MSSSYAQKGHFNNPDYSMDNYDILDGLRKAKEKKRLTSGDTSANEKSKDKKTYTIALPVVGYNPFTGLIIGAAGITSFRLGDPKTTRFSSVVPSYTQTTNNQNIFRVNSSIYTKNEDYYFFNSLLWSVAPQLTYGIGGNTSSDWATDITPSTFRFTLRAYKKVASHFYVGINYSLDYKYKIEDNTANDIQNIIDNGRSNSETSADVQSEVESQFGENKYNSFWEENEIIADGFNDGYNNNISSKELQETYFPTPFGYYPFGTDSEGYVYSGIGVNVLYDSINKERHQM